MISKIIANRLNDFFSKITIQKEQDFVKCYQILDGVIIGHENHLSIFGRGKERTYFDMHIQKANGRSFGIDWIRFLFSQLLERVGSREVFFWYTIYTFRRVKVGGFSFSILNHYGRGFG